MDGHHILIWSEDLLVAEIDKRKSDCAIEAIPNSRLIAAAPDLLEALVFAEKALNEIRVCCMHTEWERTGPAVEKARAAIAKATQI